MLRVCLIGCGSIAQAAHGPALRRLQEEGAVALAACCDVDAARAEDFKTEFRFARAYSDFEQMLRAERPDAAFALLPVRYNAACAVRVLELGCPVLLEKPPGVNAGEAAAIAGAAASAGLYHAVLFNRRSMPLALRLRELLADEEIEAVSLEMCREGRANEDFTTTAIHGIDCLRFLAGEDFASLSFAYQDDPKRGCVNYFAYGAFESGARVDMRFLPCAGAVTERVAVYTKGKQFYLHLPVWSGTTYVPGLDCPGLLTGAAGEREFLRVDGAALCGCADGYVLNGFYDEDRLALAALSEGRPTSAPVAGCLQSVEIAATMRNREPDYQKEKQ